MSDTVLGSKIPTIAVSLVRNSRQNFALRWTPPVGGELDLSEVTIVLEINILHGSKLIFPSVTVKETGEETWLSTWEIDDEDSDWPFKLANGAIVSITEDDRVVLLHTKVEVQE